MHFEILKFVIGMITFSHKLLRNCFFIFKSKAFGYPKTESTEFVTLSIY